MKHEKELFDLFVCEDDIRVWTRTPFVDEVDGRVIATNGYILVAVDKGMVDGDYPVIKKLSEPITSVEVRDSIAVSAFEDALQALPQEDEYTTTYEGKICEECDGRGMVTAEYTSKDLNIYDIEVECPVCEGTGYAVEPVQNKTGRTIPTVGCCLSVDGRLMDWRYVDTLCRACHILGVTHVTHSRGVNKEIFGLGDNIHVGIMTRLTATNVREVKTENNDAL